MKKKMNNILNSNDKNGYFNKLLKRKQVCHIICLCIVKTSMLSKVRNLFEKLTEPEAEDDGTMRKIVDNSEKVSIEKPSVPNISSTEDEDGWQLVNGKRIKSKKETIEEVTPSSTYVLSELIQKDVCIHCMSGKCREGSKSHNSVYFPEGYKPYIKNPLIIHDLDDILKKNPIKNEKFNGITFGYSICMRNHCRKRCKLNHEKIQFTDENGSLEELYFCYPDLSMINRKKIILGLHIDLKYIDYSNKKEEVSWKPRHNEYEEGMEPTPPVHMVEPESSVETSKTDEDKPVVKNVLSTWAKLVASTKAEENELKIDIPTPSSDMKPQKDSSFENSFSSRRPPNSTNFRGNPAINELLDIVKQQQKMIVEESKKTELLMEMNQKLIRLNESYQDQLYVLRSDMTQLKESIKKTNEIHQLVSKTVDSREKYKLFTEFLKDSNNSITEQIVMTNYDRYIVFS